MNKAVTINRYKVILIITILLFTLNVKAQEYKSIKTVEGIFYLDDNPISIDIEDGKIISISRMKKLVNPSQINTYIAPGFIDHQVNGYLSHSFVGEDLSIAQIKKVTKKFWEHGVTTYLPTLTTTNSERILKNCAIFAKAMEDKEIGLSIPGLHLEGPYISPIEGYRGAHNPKWIRKPDWEEFEGWYNASKNSILEITIAPEVEGAMSFIEKCREKNIVVALGHHNGSSEIILEATDAGATVSTHLGNGCANMIHRHENPLWPQLSDDRLAASIIVDGFHLRREEVRTFYKVKGPDNTILVSDVTSLAGMPPGKYGELGREVIITSDGKVMMPSQNVLAGASFLIDKGIENIISFTQCSLADAMHMASRNPARLLNLNDRGEIRLGKRADLVLFQMENNKMKILKTILAGNVVYEISD